MTASVWSDFRLGKSRGESETRGDGNRDEHRSEFQRDFDRLLFSSPVRRLADKTQVFPLEPNDSVRTRLTHSHEVANLARSVGARLHHQGYVFDANGVVSTNEVLAILQSTGLAHDLGNPPFGHQGEKAISNWFLQNQDVLAEIPKDLHPEFTAFEGNAQALRILCRLQQGAGNYGLDLTCATLSALMKYPVSCMNTGNEAVNKKYGYFTTESEIVGEIWNKTGLGEGKRHPLVWIMEAADDIAYSVLDVEDAIKKGIISPEDVRFTLKTDIRGDCGPVCDLLKADFQRVDQRDPQLSASANREVKAGYLRTRLIDRLIDEAVTSYKDQVREIESFAPAAGLLSQSKLCKRLKQIAQEHAFSSVSVTRVEARGAAAISKLMDFFWLSIRTREEKSALNSRRSEKAAYGWALLSDNYKEIAVRNHASDQDDMRTYHECRLLTDMMSGMTDGFTMSLFEALTSDGLIP